MQTLTKGGFKESVFESQASKGVGISQKRAFYVSVVQACFAASVSAMAAASLSSHLCQLMIFHIWLKYWGRAFL